MAFNQLGAKIGVVLLFLFKLLEEMKSVIIPKYRLYSYFDKVLRIWKLSFPEDETHSGFRSRTFLAVVDVAFYR